MQTKGVVRHLLNAWLSCGTRQRRTSWRPEEEMGSREEVSWEMAPSAVIKHSEQDSTLACRKALQDWVPGLWRYMRGWAPSSRYSSSLSGSYQPLSKKGRKPSSYSCLPHQGALPMKYLEQSVLPRWFGRVKLSSATQLSDQQKC